MRRLIVIADALLRPRGIRLPLVRPLYVGVWPRLRLLRLRSIARCLRTVSLPLVRVLHVGIGLRLRLLRLMYGRARIVVFRCRLPTRFPWRVLPVSSLPMAHQHRSHSGAGSIIPADKTLCAKPVAIYGFYFAATHVQGALVIGKFHRRSGTPWARRLPSTINPNKPLRRLGARMPMVVMPNRPCGNEIAGIASNVYYGSPR
jgi:hypothetical protein